MAPTPFERLKDLLDDLTPLNGPGFEWMADRAEPPIVVTLRPRERGGSVELVFDGDVPGFARHAQEVLVPAIGEPLPRCFTHSVPPDRLPMDGAAPAAIGSVTSAGTTRPSGHRVQPATPQ